MVLLMILLVKIIKKKVQIIDANDTPASVTEYWPLVWAILGCYGMNLITPDGVVLTEKPTVSPNVSAAVSPKTTAAEHTAKLLPDTKTPSLEDLTAQRLLLLVVVVTSFIILLSMTNAVWTKMAIFQLLLKILVLIRSLIPMRSMILMRIFRVILKSKFI